MSYIIQKDGNQFYLGSDPIYAEAIITYVFQDNETVMIDHTYVSPKLRGQGIAKELVDAVVKYAREKNLKVIPLCSYADRLMNASEEYRDVLASCPS